MNARELLAELEKINPLAFDKDERERERYSIMRAALEVLAAAEAGGDETPETDAVCGEPTPFAPGREVELIHGWIAFARRLERERNGLAARVGELEPDAERYRWLRDAPKTNRVPHISQYPYQPAIDRAEYPLFTTVGLDAAIDAARSK